MAKAKEAPADPAKVSSDSAAPEDVSLAVRAVMDITGCGGPAARDRVGTMDVDLVKKIAKLERDDKRVEIVTLLY